MHPIPDQPRRGRGAVSNRAGRYERHDRQAEDDGWGDGRDRGRDGAGDDGPPPLRTAVGVDASRTVIARNDSPDIGFDRSINAYRGCEHGCAYCYARPTHAWLGLSPGLDFESRLFAKQDAPARLRRELAAPRYRPAVIAMGTSTDPYQPIERERRITRGILEVLAETGHPCTITTKSALVLRDLDILAPMARRRLVSVGISVTTLDPALARAMEPRAPTPARRLAAIRELARAGIPTAVMAAPMIPSLNDHELEAILEAAAADGARMAAWILLRLPGEVRDLFREWLEAHRPDRAGRVLGLLQECRGGRSGDGGFGTRMRGSGAYAALLQQRFDRACRRLGLDRRHHALDVSGFRPPAADARQLALL